MSIPPEAASESGNADRDCSDVAQLQDQLQRLWLRYLHALEQYTSAQKRIRELSSAGTFALAQANFKNSTGSRYGPNHFDQRMQACTHAQITPDGQALKVVSELASTSSSKTKEKNGMPSDHAQDDDAPEKDTKPTAVDPLRWFGILVPAQLRTCQTNFVSLVTEPLADAVNSSKELRRIEVDIRKLRKDLRKAERLQTTA